MTFFSIQKSLFFLVLTVLCVGASLTPLAAQTQPPAEEIEKLKAEDQRLADERQGKVNAPIVLELFTTSDCPACVFADRILYDTMNQKNVIALSCRIKDLSEVRGRDEEEKSTGSESYKGPMDPCVFRQWAYKTGRSVSDVTINIPMFMINGQEPVDANDMTYFTQMMNSFGYNARNKTVDAFMKWKDADTISVHLPQKEESYVSSASVWIIRYKDMEVEKIDKGINKGRVLRFSNIIQNIRHIGKWHGQMRTIEVDVEKPKGGKDRGGYVVLVQEMMGEPVIAAGKLVDYPLPGDKELAHTAPATPAAKTP